MIFSLPLQASVAPVVRAMAFCALGWASWSMAADPVASAVSAKPDVQGAVDLASAFDGHVLVTPLKSKETVLVDGKGKEVHVWTSAYEAAAGARLLPDGSILRIAVEKPAKTFRSTGLQGGRLQRIGWNGEVLWDFWNAAAYHMVVGDATVLPNGNVLMLVAEYKSQDDVIALGRDRDRVTLEGLYAPGLMEFEPKGDKGGRLVWRWSAWDHVAQDRHPSKPGYHANLQNLRQWDINAGIEWRGVAATELSYDPASDLVLLTSSSSGEIWLLDHNNTTNEAAGDRGGARNLGGRPLMRWRSNRASDLRSSSKVLSASFGGPSQGGLPSIHLLAWREASTAQATFTVESLLPNLIGSEDGQRLGVSQSVELSRWVEPLETVQRLLPASLDRGPLNSHFLGRTRSGLVEWREGASEGFGKKWEYQSGRGMTTFSLLSKEVDAELCCQGGSAPPQAAKGQILGMRAPLMGRPHFYPTGYLNASLGLPSSR